MSNYRWTQADETPREDFEANQAGADNAEMNNLRPCPFCGGNVEIFTKRWIDGEGYDDQMTYVDCPNHNMIIRPDEWNTRQVEDAIKQEYSEMIAEFIARNAKLYSQLEAVKSENDQLRAALKLCLPILQNDVYEEDSSICYYCGEEIDSGDEHKDDCKQLVAYLAAKATLEGK